MRPFNLTATGVADSVPGPLDTYCNPFNVALKVIVGAGCTVTVQYTQDDVYAAGFNPATANWKDHPTLAGLTATNDGNIAFPVSAVRLHQTAGAATSTLQVRQSGIGT